MDKIVRPGKLEGADLFIHITSEPKENPDKIRLSITGVIGPEHNGNARGSCGQIISSFKEYSGRGYFSITDIEPAKFWHHNRIKRLFDIWDRWHLNDMRAGCKHQRQAGWNKKPIDPDRPLDSYGCHFDGQGSPTWNMLGWVRPDEFPGGLLGAPCPECGYKYGTAWLYEEVPGSILTELENMPDTDKKPAWV